MRGVEEAVIELQIIMNDGNAARWRTGLFETLVNGFECSVGSIVACQPPAFIPAIQLAFDKSLGMRAIAEADGIDIDRLECHQGIH